MDQSVTQEKIREVGKKIADKFRPDKIILFGSWAWGNPGPDSDVDLFIIQETENNRKTSREIDGWLFPRPFPLDLMLYTPEQVRKRSEAGDFFVKSILEKGKLIYEK